MKTFILRRFIQLVIMVFLTTLMVFLIMRFLPGDPVLVYISSNEINDASPKQIEQLRHKFGLDKPVAVQYVNWLGDLLHGDLGKSVINGTTVNEEIARALPKTMYLGGAAFLLSILGGISLGIISAIRRGKWADTVSTLIANLGITAPSFWIGIILILIFGYHLGWLPIQGWVSPADNLKDGLLHMLMPVICLTVYTGVVKID